MPPRGRPRAFDRERALERGMCLLWRRGYEAASLSELVEVMGINVSSFYAAFGSKEALFREAVDRYQATHGAFAEAALRGGGTAFAAVERLLRGAAAALTDPDLPRGCKKVTAAANCSPRSAEVAEECARRRRCSEAALRERVARGLAAGELPAGTDAAALARFYATVFQGLSTQARDGASREELERVVDFALAAWPAPQPAGGGSGERRANAAGAASASAPARSVP